MAMANRDPNAISERMCMKGRHEPAMRIEVSTEKNRLSNWKLSSMIDSRSGARRRGLIVGEFPLTIN